MKGGLKIFLKEEGGGRIKEEAGLFENKGAGKYPLQTMEVCRLRVLAFEVLCSVNKLNPVCMQSLFEKNVNSKRHKDDLKVPIRNSVTFGDQSVRVLVPHIWNMLPAELKRETSYRKFKTQINN